MGEEVIVGSRVRPALYLLLSGALAGGSGRLVAGGDHDWRGFVGLGIFGLGVVVFLYQLIRPPRLTLGAKGLTIVSMGRTRNVAWDDVESFQLWKPPRGPQVVAWSYKPGRGKAGVVGAMNRSLGADGALPPMLESAGPLLDKIERHFTASRRP